MSAQADTPVSPVAGLLAAYGLSEVTPADQIEEIDRMLFDAGLMVLASKNNRDRKAADSKIMDARVKLGQLRKRLT